MEVALINTGKTKIKSHTQEISMTGEMIDLLCSNSNAINHITMALDLFSVNKRAFKIEFNALENVNKAWGKEI